MPTTTRLLEQARRRVLIHRRALIAVAVALLVWSTLRTLHPAEPPSVTVWAAARDLPAGTVLEAGDLRRTSWSADDPPVAAHDRATLLGRTLAGPLGEGEIATTTDLVGSERMAGYPGKSAVPIRIPDADAAGLLRIGDEVDLVSSDPQSRGPGTRLVDDAIVLALPRAGSTGSSPALTGRLVLFAVPTADVAEIASAASTLFLTVIWNR
ncbi:pilus assembly protein CpaB [Marmoricola sp. OAE513]|uniref:SAF domain-containing protein n=1 Tax=Marmoricola sp. OAE513 TaxID=2817894 RepID=UPI001AE58724